MSVDARIDELSHRHQELEMKLEAEQKNPSSDMIKLKELKQQKLRIKDEIRQLRSC